MSTASLDVRLPMGLMFVLLGGLLAVFGIFSDASVYDISLKINVNLWWGLVILAFGAFMLLLAWRGKARARPAPGSSR